MKTLVAILIVAGLALPASADGCGTGTIDWVGTSPRLTVTGGADGIRFDIVGHYVDYIVDGQLASAEIPESAEAVTVCADGVTFTVGEAVNRRPVPAQLIEDVDAQTLEAFHPAGVYPD